MERRQKSQTMTSQLHPDLGARTLALVQKAEDLSQQPSPQMPSACIQTQPLQVQSLSSVFSRNRTGIREVTFQTNYRETGSVLITSSLDSTVPIQ